MAGRIHILPVSTDSVSSFSEVVFDASYWECLTVLLHSSSYIFKNYGSNHALKEYIPLQLVIRFSDFQFPSFKLMTVYSAV